jgi:hypothetical protein
LHRLYQAYGAPAGRREVLQAYAPTIMAEASRTGDMDTLLSLIKAMGGDVSPDMRTALQRAASYRSNPWIPTAWG